MIEFADTVTAGWNLLEDPALNNLPGGIIIYEVTPDHVKIHYLNNKAYKILGCKTEEIDRSRELELADFVVEWELERVQKELTTDMELDGSCVCWFQGKECNGRNPWYSLHAEQMKTVSSRRLYLAILLDVTKSKEEELEAKKLAVRSQYIFEHDSLTGLYRKEIFEKKVDALLAANPQGDYAIIMWDAEHFKLINELFGYETGNQLLVRAAALMRRYVGNKGVAGRVGADQFIACIPLERLDMQKTFRRIKRTIDEMHLDYEVRISAGIYVIIDKKEPVAFMCDKASMALSSIKGKYMESYAYYDSKMMHSMIHEQELKNEMQEALDQEQFKIYVQPKYDIASGAIVGGEALVRWQHPGKGFVSPNEFIPYFEKNGFISSMDQYIWKNVAEYLENCVKESKRVLPISVNASRIDFYRDNLYEHFTELLKEYNLASKYLELEVTESAYTADEDVIYSTLEQLQKVGMTILIDDFGSGYSSFNMMKQAPVDVLKLDMEFLRGLDEGGRGKTIVKHMVQLAQDLMIPVIAEGVETKEHVELLQEIGCDYAQGYYYSKPVPLEEYDKMVQKSRK